MAFFVFRVSISGLLALVLAGCAAPLPRQPLIERLPADGTEARVPARSGFYSADEIVALAASDDPEAVLIQKLRDVGQPQGVAEREAGSLLARGVPAGVVFWLRFGDRAPPQMRSYPAHGPYGYPHMPPCWRDPFCRPWPGSGFSYHQFLGPDPWSGPGWSLHHRR